MLLSNACGTLRHPAMDCPHCDTTMDDMTERWPTLAEAKGAEYLASYVTIWRCPSCQTLAGAEDEGIEWVMEHEAANIED